MLKKILLAVMIAIPACMFAQSAKFGVVNAQEIISVMPEYKEAGTKLDATTQQYEEEFKKLNDEIEKKYAEFQKIQNDPKTADAIKERRMQEIQELAAKADQFRNNAQQEIQNQQVQLLQPIQEKLVKAIQKVGADNGFTMIFPAEVPAYVSTTVIDATPLVKKELGIK